MIHGRPFHRFEILSFVEARRGPGEVPMSDSCYTWFTVIILLLIRGRCSLERRDETIWHSEWLFVREHDWPSLILLYIYIYNNQYWATPIRCFLTAQLTRRPFSPLSLSHQSLLWSWISASYLCLETWSFHCAKLTNRHTSMRNQHPPVPSRSANILRPILTSLVNHRFTIPMIIEDLAATHGITVSIRTVKRRYAWRGNWQGLWGRHRLSNSRCNSFGVTRAWT